MRRCEDMNNKIGFMKIMQSVDAFFPIGAFTLSNGLESYVLEDWIRTPEDLKQYLDGFLHTFCYQDLGLMHLAYEHADDKEFIAQLHELAGAMKIPMEVRIGSSRMGKRFVKALERMDDKAPLVEWYKDGFHPIALGIYASSCGIDEEQLLTMYGYGTISAIVNNAVKLVPLSQMEGQRILHGCFPVLEQCVKKTLDVTIDALGVSAVANDIHCMRHERLYTRQYMS